MGHEVGNSFIISGLRRGVLLGALREYHLYEDRLRSIDTACAACLRLHLSPKTRTDEKDEHTSLPNHFKGTQGDIL